MLDFQSGGSITLANVKPVYTPTVVATIARKINTAIITEVVFLAIWFHCFFCFCAFGFVSGNLTGVKIRVCSFAAPVPFFNWLIVWAVTVLVDLRLSLLINAAIIVAAAPITVEIIVVK